MAWQLSLGLLHLHSHDIIHRDIKSMNIFITDNKTLKVRKLEPLKDLFRLAISACLAY